MSSAPVEGALKGAVQEINVFLSKIKNEPLDVTQESLNELAKVLSEHNRNLDKGISNLKPSEAINPNLLTDAMKAVKNLYSERGAIEQIAGAEQRRFLVILEQLKHNISSISDKGEGGKIKRKEKAQ